MNDSTDKEIEIFNLTAEKLYSFIERLVIEIKNYKFSYNDKNQCYLILDTWLHNLINNIKEYKRNNYYLYNKTNPDGSFIFWPYDNPIFINNIPLAIDYLKKYQYLEVINRELLVLIYEDEYLRSFKTINYFCGNNRLIIEYEDKLYNSSILIIDPLESFHKNIVIFKVNKNEFKNKLYEKLILTERNIDNSLMNDLKSKNEIISFQEIISNNKIKTYIKYNTFNITNILCIYFFYYEKSFSYYQIFA